MEVFMNIFASNNCFSEINTFENGVDALFEKDDQKLTFYLFGLSDYVQILLACGTNTYYGITDGISDFRCQHLQR